MGTEFPFGKVRKFHGWTVGVVTKQHELMHLKLVTFMFCRCNHNNNFLKHPPHVQRGQIIVTEGLGYFHGGSIPRPGCVGGIQEEAVRRGQGVGIEKVVTSGGIRVQGGQPGCIRVPRSPV